MIHIRRFIFDRWHADAWWALGIIAMVVINLAFFPGLKGKDDLDQTLADLPPALQAMFGIESGVSIGSAAGYLQAQLFSTVVPILLLVLAIAIGSGAVGGAEEDGSAEFLLSYPVSRARFLIDRFAALTVVIAAHTFILLVAVFTFCALFGALDGVSRTGLAAACIACGALAMFHASIAFAAGAWFGRKSPAIAGRQRRRRRRLHAARALFGGRRARGASLPDAVALVPQAEPHDHRADLGGRRPCARPECRRRRRGLSAFPRP